MKPELGGVTSLSVIDHLAHHVRSPLAGVSGALSVLRERGRMAPDERAVVDEILTRLCELNVSIGNMIDLSRPLLIHPQRVRLSALVRSAVLRVERPGANAPATMELTDDGLEVVVDPELMCRALGHLLRNGVEAGAGAPLRVRTARTQRACTIEIVDEGGGWSEAMGSHMFEPFITTKSQHLGVGLTVARRIVEAHGGEIHGSRDQGLTTMRVRLCFAP